MGGTRSPTTHHSLRQLWYMGGTRSWPHITVLGHRPHITLYGNCGTWAVLGHRPHITLYWQLWYMGGTRSWPHITLYSNCGTWAVLCHWPHIKLYGNCVTWAVLGHDHTSHFMATVVHGRYCVTDHTSHFTGNCGTWVVLGQRPHITLYMQLQWYMGLTGSLPSHSRSPIHALICQGEFLTQLPLIFAVVRAAPHKGLHTWKCWTLSVADPGFDLRGGVDFVNGRGGG